MRENMCNANLVVFQIITHIDFEKSIHFGNISRTNEFWQQLRFDSVDYRIENWKSIEMTEATAFVSYQNQTFRLKMGELIKTPHGWKIMVQRGPWWK